MEIVNLIDIDFVKRYIIYFLFSLFLILHFIYEYKNKDKILSKKKQNKIYSCECWDDLIILNSKSVSKLYRINNEYFVFVTHWLDGSFLGLMLLKVELPTIAEAIELHENSIILYKNKNDLVIHYSVRKNENDIYYLKLIKVK